MRFFSTLAASVLGSLIAIGLVFLFGLVLLIGMAAAGETAPGVRSGSVLVADLSGDWPESVSPDPLSQLFAGGPAIDLHDVTSALRRAGSDDRIEAVWLRIGLITAPWSSLGAVRRAVEEVREQGKPVYATSSSFMMAENGYYLASAADSIFLDEESMFELNGFRVDVTFYTGLLEKLGVEPQAIRAGRFKSAVEPYTRTDLSVDAEYQLQELVDRIDNRFVQSVATARGIDPSAIRSLMAGTGMLSARDAHRAGLVDDLVFADQVEDHLRDRIGLSKGDRIPTVSLRAYARVSGRDPIMGTGGSDEIAIVVATGTIMPGDTDASPFPGLGESMLGSASFARTMREARQSESVRAVVLRIDSPGGFAPAADAMLREIQLTAAEKPVIVSMGSVAASGGYWMAMAADTIVAEPLTQTGSIGVFSLFFNTSGLFENHLGISFDGLSTAPSADMISGLRPLNPGEVAMLERGIDSTYHNFLKKVATGRGMTLARVDSLGQGRVWSGEDARSVGLVDVTGGLETAVQIAAERAGIVDNAFRVRWLPRPESFIERLSRSAEVRAARVVSRLTGTIDPRVATLAAQMDLIRKTAGTVQARLPVGIDIR